MEEDLSKSKNTLIKQVICSEVDKYKAKYLTEDKDEDESCNDSIA